MLTVKTIRNMITKGLRTTTGSLAIVSEREGDKPPYPYSAVKFTVLGNKVGQGTQYMQGGRQVNEQDTEMVLSVSCYSDTVDGASDSAYKALEYFEVHGVIPLQESHIAIVDVTNITDRTTFLTTDWEYRMGFDVRLRVRTQVISDVDVVDNVTLTGNVIDFNL